MACFVGVEVGSLGRSIIFEAKNDSKRINSSINSPNTTCCSPFSPLERMSLKF